MLRRRENHLTARRVAASMKESFLQYEVHCSVNMRVTRRERDTLRRQHERDLRINGELGSRLKQERRMTRYSDHFCFSLIYFRRSVSVDPTREPSISRQSDKDIYLLASS